MNAWRYSLDLLSKTDEDNLHVEEPGIQRNAMLMYTAWAIYAKCTHTRAQALPMWNDIEKDRNIMKLVENILNRRFNGVINWITHFQALQFPY